MKDRRRILLLGFDALTYKLIKKWIYHLDGFRELMSDSRVSWGALESTMPPLSPSAWAAIATGMNPGKTGIFGWMVFDKKSKHLKSPSLRNIKGLTFWDIAMLIKKMKVAVIRFPVIAYPQYNRELFGKLGGILISGIPIEDITPKSVFPEELAWKLSRDPTLKIVPIVNVDIRGNAHSVRNIIRKSLLKWHKVSLELFKSQDWDIFAAVFTELDLIQHYFMGHMDPEYPYKEYLDKGFEDTVFSFYMIADRILRDYLNRANDYDIVVVSDHGAGPVYYDLNVNWILARMGLLKYFQRKTVDLLGFKKHIRDIATNIVEKRAFLQKLIGNMPSFVHRYMIDRFRNIWLKSTTEYVLSTAEIDKTSAIAFGDFSGIYILDNSDVECIKKALECAISKIARKLPNNIREKISLKIFDAKSIFRTRNSMSTMPNLVVYGEILKPTSRLPTQPPILPPIRTGDHIRDGFYLIKSDLIENSYMKDSRQAIYNIAPTLLAMLGLPIPDIVDGRPIFKVGSIKTIDYRRLMIKMRLSARRYVES